MNVHRLVNAPTIFKNRFLCYFCFLLSERDILCEVMHEKWCMFSDAEKRCCFLRFVCNPVSHNSLISGHMPSTDDFSSSGTNWFGIAVAVSTYLTVILVDERPEVALQSSLGLHDRVDGQIDEEYDEHIEDQMVSKDGDDRVNVPLVLLIPERVRTGTYNNIGFKHYYYYYHVLSQIMLSNTVPKQGDQFED